MQTRERRFPALQAKEGDSNQWLLGLYAGWPHVQLPLHTTGLPSESEVPYTYFTV